VCPGLQRDALRHGVVGVANPGRTPLTAQRSGRNGKTGPPGSARNPPPPPARADDRRKTTLSLQGNRNSKKVTASQGDCSTLMDASPAGVVSQIATFTRISALVTHWSSANILLTTSRRKGPLASRDGADLYSWILQGRCLIRAGKLGLCFRPRTAGKETSMLDMGCHLVHGSAKCAGDARLCGGR